MSFLAIRPIIAKKDVSSAFQPLARRLKTNSVAGLVFTRVQDAVD
ncbi:hypothetical protein THTE_3792 [Thermogutta terrifontis]|uniref:Uncharacterized protein n=1 Tax=Thermogutta terrifontis TaxID=1331910 RepID=A0A286RK87_9BACT|nr:hypothetical protein THTE_3792 [Thermogutta terrifontis]